MQRIPQPRVLGTQRLGLGVARLSEVDAGDGVVGLGHIEVLRGVAEVDPALFEHLLRP